MGQAIGGALPFAIGVALSPVPIIAVVLMLGSPKARTDGPAFAVGWIVGLSAVGTIVLLVTSGRATSDSGEPATWDSVLELALGLAFAFLAVKQWRGRPKAGEEAPMPKWMRAIDTFSEGKSLLGGVVLSALNPKNLALTVAAAASIAEAGISSGEEAVAMGVFVLVGSVTILAPLALYFAMGDRAKPILEGLKAWMTAHNAAIMTVILLVLGGKLIGDSIAGFSA